MTVFKLERFRLYVCLRSWRQRANACACACALCACVPCLMCGIIHPALCCGGEEALGELLRLIGRVELLDNLERKLQARARPLPHSMSGELCRAARVLGLGGRACVSTWLVMTLPSSTTLESSQSGTTALNLSTGKHVARAGSRPCGANTTAGAAQTAATSLLALAWARSISLSSAESRRCSAPGIPPGQAMASHCLPTHSVM